MWWPWSLWASKTTQTRPLPYLQTPVPTGSLTRTPLPDLKTNLPTLRDITQTGTLNDLTYRKVYLTSAVPPKFYGLPKIHKVGTPLRPMVSSRCSIAYGLVKELANIIHPLVGQSPNHLKTLNILHSTYKRQDWNQVRSLHHMILRPSLHQFLLTLPYN